jgi:radical SAM protein with 4Fe4S-binding SPASM domain
VSGSLMRAMGAKALKLGIPLSVQLDLTYRCNEKCIHCYLDHEDHGELTTAEVKALLDQLAEAGVFFLILSGGEIFLRRDLFELVEHARRLLFSVKLKTNAVMIRKAKAARIAALGVDSVQISVYSHKPDVHDAITKLPGSFRRTIEGARLLKAAGVRVSFANVLMRHNAGDYPQVQALAETLGVEYSVDATITPMMDGDRSILDLNIDADALEDVYRDATLVGNVEEFCAPPSGPLAEADALDTLPCSAGHTACYVSPYGDVYPCVQFPLPSGNVRQARFLDIWRSSPQLQEVRSITMAELQGCAKCVHGSSCSRCPGLAYTEGNMRGPSIQDCEKSFARTGVPSRNLLQKKKAPVTGLEAGRNTSRLPPGSSGQFPIKWMQRK